MSRPEFWNKFGKHKGSLKRATHRCTVFVDSRGIAVVGGVGGCWVCPKGAQSVAAGINLMVCSLDTGSLWPSVSI